MVLIGGNSECEFCDHTLPLHMLHTDETGREEGKFADKFHDRKVQRQAIASWKIALERLRVGIILKFPRCFLTACRQRKAGR